jgi:TRAP-type C4-dicarboxylate transport system permease small subunit
MVLCGVALAGSTTTVFFDVVTRSLGHPVLWVQEVTTTFFVYGIFIGYLNFRQGFGAYRMPSLTPLASLYAAIPLSGALVALFMVEQLVNGWRNSFAGAAPETIEEVLDSDRFRALP